MQLWLLRRQAAAVLWEDKPVPSPSECRRSTNSPLHQCLPLTGSRTEWCHLRLIPTSTQSVAQQGA